MNGIFFLSITIKLALSRFLSVRFVFIFILIIVLFSNLFFSKGSSYTPTVFPYLSILIVYIFLYYPFLIYTNAKKNFKTSSALNETIRYTIDEDRLIINAESFDYSTKWNNIIQFQKIGDCLLLYASKTTAYYINLNQIDVIDQIYFLDILKNIANGNDIKSNLK